MKESTHVQVVYVITKLELGGAQKVCLSLFKGVRDCGGTSCLISGPEGVLVPSVRQYDSVYLLKSLQREVSLFSLVYRELKAFKDLVSAIRRLQKKYTHLIVHTHSTKAGIMGRWAAWCAGVKVRIHTVHGFGFHHKQFFLSWFFHFIMEWLTSLITTHYVCVSQADRTQGTALLPRFRKKSSLIRAAVDQYRYYAARKSDEREEVARDHFFTFGTIACFKPQKNLIDLFKAFHAMKERLSFIDRQRARLEVIGDGTLRPVLEKWIREHELEESITLLGWQDDVAPFLRRWQVFTLSSLWEGLPCAVVEARLNALPVIAYQVGGIAEVIKDGENGFLIPPGKWNSLSDAMRRVLSDEKLYQRMRSRRDKLDDFDTKVMVQKHYDLYKSLVN